MVFWWKLMERIFVDTGVKEGGFFPDGSKEEYCLLWKRRQYSRSRRPKEDRGILNLVRKVFLSDQNCIMPLPLYSTFCLNGIGVQVCLHNVTKFIFFKQFWDFRHCKNTTFTKTTFLICTTIIWLKIQPVYKADHSLV